MISRQNSRMFHLSKLALFSLALAVLSTFAQAADPVSGKVSIIKSTGKVTAVSKAGGSKPAVQGSVITQGTKIETGENSSAILLFSNGSSITVGSNASFSVDEFMQDPFDAKSFDVKTDKEEPSKSKVKTTLNKGEILGDMKKLKSGSKFEFVTQLGVAGIRGTKFKMSMQTVNGKPVWKITCTEGAVAVQPTKNGAPNGDPIVVSPKGEGAEAQATIITLTLDDEGNLVPVGEPTLLSVAETQAVNGEIATSEAVISTLPEGFVPGEGETLFSDNPSGTNDFGGDQGPLNLGSFGSGGSGGGGSGGQTSGDLPPSS